MMRGLLLLCLTAGCSAFGPAGEGDRHYQAGNYTRAVEAYEAAIRRGGPSARLRYNLGTALLRLERYAEAREQLEAATAFPAGEIQQRAYYNAGNADLEPAFRGRQTEPRPEHLRRAIAAYQRALLLAPADTDAKWNLELAQRLLAAEQRSGGGADNPQSGGGRGGGGPGNAQAAAQPDPRPAAGSGSGDQPQMTRAEAERLLTGVEQREREQQRAALRRDQVRLPRVRDW